MEQFCAMRPYSMAPRIGPAEFGSLGSWATERHPRVGGRKTKV